LDLPLVINPIGFPEGEIILQEETFMRSETFVRHGTNQKRIEIESGEILNAIADGHAVDIKYAVIDGDIKTNGLSEESNISDISIRDSEIHGNVIFKSSVFKGNLSFSGSIFSGNVDSESASFSGDVDFSSVTFNNHVSFERASFGRDTDFNGASFGGSVTFESASFDGNLNLSRTAFGAAPSFGNSDFSRARFGDKVNFESARFDGKVDFSETNFPHDENFNSANFRLGADFDNVSIGGSGREIENQEALNVKPAGEPILLTEKDDMGRIFYYRENDVYELRIEMRSYRHSYFMSGKEWKEFTDLSGQDERKEFFIQLEDEYPELDKHLIHDSIRMDFLNFIESSYDGSQQTHMKHPFHHKADSSDGND
jgi:hypothetical protein